MVRRNKKMTQSAFVAKKKESFLRAYTDIRCPYCGSNVYWGTHRCRRCGKDFPEKLSEEVDRRTMMHYIPIEYKAIQKEKNLTNIIILTVIAFLILIAVSALLYGPITENIRVYYLISWVFFVTSIMSTMMTIFYMTDEDTMIIAKPNILLTFVIMGISGMSIGIVAFIQVTVFPALEIELLVAAVFIILSTLSIAAGRAVWPRFTFSQISLIAFGSSLLTWPFLKAFVRTNWAHNFINSAGSPFSSLFVTILGLIFIVAGTYSLFHGQTFTIRINICYPNWFCGISFLSLTTFFRAALFRPELNLSYIEALLLIIGIMLCLISLLLFVRKKMADNYINGHISNIKHEFTSAESLYSAHNYNRALEAFEKLLRNNPVLSFGTTNDHPALELLGIDFIPKPVRTSKDEIGKREEGGTDELREEGTSEGSVEVEGEEKKEEVRDYTEAEDGEERELRQAEALALLKKSTFYEKAGQRRKALSCLERSVKLDRSNPETWIRLGHIMAQQGVTWNKIRGYYDWVIDLKLKAIQSWIETEKIPPQYTLWLLEETVVLKNNLLGIGRVLRSQRSKETTRPNIMEQHKVRD